MEFKTVILLTIKRFEILKEFEIIHQRPRNALIFSQVRKLIENLLITYNHLWIIADKIWVEMGKLKVRWLTFFWVEMEKLHKNELPYWLSGSGLKLLVWGVRNLGGRGYRSLFFHKLGLSCAKLRLI